MTFFKAVYERERAFLSLILAPILKVIMRARIGFYGELPAFVCFSYTYIYHRDEGLIHTRVFALCYKVDGRVRVYIKQQMDIREETNQGITRCVYKPYIGVAGVSSASIAAC